MYDLIVDTAPLIAVERGTVSMTGLADADEDIAIAAVSVAELWFGVEMAGAEDRVPRAMFVRRMVELFTVENYDLDVARVHGRLLAETRRLGRQRGSYDLIIPATAADRERGAVAMDKGIGDAPRVQWRLVVLGFRA